MNTQQDRHAQMQAKLREGLDILSRASNEDGYQLGMALLKLHAALEDQFRLEIASRAPSLRMEVDDLKKTSWKELIRYGKQYLGLRESEARVIVEANRHRQSVAHGGNYGWSRGELVKYADFVERWCDPGKYLTYEYRQRMIPPAPKAYPPPALPSAGKRSASRTPWYRSTLFLFLVFFLVPPLWSLSILSDRRQGCLLKLAAGAWLAVQLAAAAIVLDPAASHIRAALPWNEPSWNVQLRWGRATAMPAETASPTTPAQANQVRPPSSTASSCALVWAEYPSGELAGKNRSMVWGEIVMRNVDGSGMTARQFYDQVLERNPDLASDGYEFKAGKKYLLPRCE